MSVHVFDKEKGIEEMEEVNTEDDSENIENDID